LKWAKDKGIFIKVRVGKKMFDPSTQKRTTAREDVMRKRKEKNGSQMPKM